MKNIIFLALISTMLLASCGLTKTEISETVGVDDTMMNGEHEGEWTEEEMKEMEMMDGEHEDSMMEDKMMDKGEDEVMMKDDAIMNGEHEGEWTEEEMKEMKMMNEEHEDSMMEEKMMDDSGDEVMMKKEGVYAAYNENLIGATDNTVLFFHAAWCPSCRAADTAISAETIPENLTILKTDFDSHTQLKKKYKVVAQHTFVQVDSDGNEIKKWVGGNSIEDILERIK